MTPNGRHRFKTSVPPLMRRTGRPAFLYRRRRPPGGRPMVSASCQASDLSAKRMRALHAAHAKAVYHLLLRLTHGDRPAAEDLARETMLRASRHIDGLETDDPDPERMRRWLYTLARRVAIDAARARPAEAGTDDPVERAGRARAVRQALAALSP